MRVCVFVCASGLCLIIVLLLSFYFHQNSSAKDGGGGSGGYVSDAASEASAASEGSDAGDDHTDGDVESDGFSDDEEEPSRCEKCDFHFDVNKLSTCEACHSLYCQKCLGCAPFGEEVR